MSNISYDHHIFLYSQHRHWSTSPDEQVFIKNVTEHLLIMLTFKFWRFAFLDVVGSAPIHRTWSSNVVFIFLYLPTAIVFCSKLSLKPQTWPWERLSRQLNFQYISTSPPPPCPPLHRTLPSSYHPPLHHYPNIFTNSLLKILRCSEQLALEIIGTFS